MATRVLPHPSPFVCLIWFLSGPRNQDTEPAPSGAAHRPSVCGPQPAPVGHLTHPQGRKQVRLHALLLVGQRGRATFPGPGCLPRWNKGACPTWAPTPWWPALPPTQGICLPSWWGGDLTCEPQTINMIPPTHLCLSGFAGVWKKWDGGSCRADPGGPGSTA